MYNGEMRGTRQKMLQIKNDLDALKVQFSTATNRDDKKKLALEANKAIEEFRRAKRSPWSMARRQRRGKVLATCIDRDEESRS